MELYMFRDELLSVRKDVDSLRYMILAVSVKKSAGDQMLFFVESVQTKIKTILTHLDSEDENNE